jgi:hypothetical protein
MTPANPAVTQFRRERYDSPRIFRSLVISAATRVMVFSSTASGAMGSFSLHPGVRYHDRVSRRRPRHVDYFRHLAAHRDNLPAKLRCPPSTHALSRPLFTRSTRLQGPQTSGRGEERCRCGWRQRHEAATTKCGETVLGSLVLDHDRMWME